MGKIKELDLAKDGSRDGRGCESPRPRISAEFEAGHEQANTDAWLGASDQWQLREDVWGARTGHCDPDQTALGRGRLDLALHARDWNLRAGRLPLVLGAEPRDWRFVRLVLGGRWRDAARVDDRAEFQARCVVVDVLGRIGAGWDLVGVGNGNELDVDLHAGRFLGRIPGAPARERNQPPEREISGYEKATEAS